MAVLAILSLFRLIEARLPSEFYAHHVLTFSRDSVMPEAKVRELLSSHGFSIANLSSRLKDDGKQFQFEMVLRSRDPKSAETLSQHLRDLPEVVAFRISPTGD